MHLAFVDIAYGYDASRPDGEESLGGTTSAICFLARALVKSGIKCTIFNKINAPCIAHDIPALPLSVLADPTIYSQYSAFIFCGRWLETIVQLIRASTSAPLIAWMHESEFTLPFVPPLDLFNAVVFVSEWQQRINQVHSKKHWRQAVIRNGMNPLAATLFPHGSPILAAKTSPPVLLYSGTFVRGAFHLAPILKKLRTLDTHFTMEVFCNTTPSGHTESDQKYMEWLREQPNITHVGMVGQSKLLQHMKRASLMVSPNPWPETSCIAMIEGMAAGLNVLSTMRAALPETASGFATLLPIENADHPSQFDIPIDYDAFAYALYEALRSLHTNVNAAEKARRAQVDFFLNHYQWSQRVAPWVELLKSI